MQNEIPQNLQSTVRLLDRSYPEGLAEDRLLPVLRLLYNELSDRNLALVASQVACLEPSIALHKVYEAAALDVHDPRVQAAAERLKKHGYDAWLAEVQSKMLMRHLLAKTLLTGGSHVHFLEGLSKVGAILVKGSN